MQKPPTWSFSFWLYSRLLQDLITLDEGVQLLRLEYLYRRTGS